MRRLFPAAVMVAALFFVGLACNAILGHEPGVIVAADVAAEAAGVCGLDLDAGACGACVAANCCEQASACAKVASCAALESCTLACRDDYACRARCAGGSPVSNDDQIPVLDQCVVTQCAKPCGISCGLTHSYTDPDAAQQCQDCIASHACGAVQSCGESLDCARLSACFDSCITHDCAFACVVEHEDSSAAFASLVGAVGGTCLQPCRAGHYWECVGKVTWPFVKAQQLTAELTLTNAMTNAPVVGVEVKACDVGDVNCSGRMASATTDATGLARIPVPGGNVYGFGGYFDIAATPDTPPHLYFLSFPLSEPRAILNLALVSNERFREATAGLTVPTPDGGTKMFAPDPNLGSAIIVFGDCHRIPAYGVHVNVVSGGGPGMLVRYLDGPTLSNTANMGDILAFLLNAQTYDVITAETIPVDIGRASSRVQLFTRPGAISVVQAFPTPAM